MSKTIIAMWILPLSAERGSGRLQRSREPSWECECQGLLAISEGVNHMKSFNKFHCSKIS